MSAHLSSPCSLTLSTEVKGALRTEESPHPYDKHTSRKHTQSLCASDGCHSQLIQLSEHILPSIAQKSRLQLTFTCSQVKILL